MHDSSHLLHVFQCRRSFAFEVNVVAVGQKAVHIDRVLFADRVGIRPKVITKRERHNHRRCTSTRISQCFDGLFLFFLFLFLPSWKKFSVRYSSSRGHNFHSPRFTFSNVALSTVFLLIAALLTVYIAVRRLNEIEHFRPRVTEV